MDEIAGLLELGQDMVERVGDCSNLEHKVNRNSALWKTVVRCGELTLQKDCFSGKARIVDEKGIQKGNGSLSAMREKMERLSADDFLRPGDVIGVSRGPYEHYAIYAGAGRVIHYAGETSDFNGMVSIHEAPFEEFLKGSGDYFVVSFDGQYPVKIHSATQFMAGTCFDCWDRKRKDRYSAEETLRRAYSRVGETKYSILTNNCEHFALWCKTGKAESTQVKRIARYVLVAGISLRGIAESQNDIIDYLDE